MIASVLNDANPHGFFAALPMNSPVCHSERSEESNMMHAGAYPTGSFARLRMTGYGSSLARITQVGFDLVGSLRMTGLLGIESIP